MSPKNDDRSQDTPKMAKTGKKEDKFKNKVIGVSLPQHGLVRKRAVEFVQLSQAFAEKRQWLTVINIARQVTETLPGYSDPWGQLFAACDRAGDYPLLLSCADKCLTHKPRFVAALIARATALRFLQQPGQAMNDIVKAQKLSPSDVSVLNHLGILQKELGLNQEAAETFDRCIAIKPDYTAAHWNRSDLLTDPSDDQLKQIIGLLDKKALSPNQRARLHYAAARAFEYCGDYESQFRHIEQGATAKRRSVDYRVDAELEEMRAIPSHFTQKLLSQRAPAESAASSPIFICGLPRSGTTLAEQILSAHPEVTAGDEINAFPSAAAQCLSRLKTNKPYPQWVGNLAKEDWRVIGETYLSQTQWLQKSRFFTDKNLQNYRVIGLIHLALPNAKIVYCRRDPMDNLWGCYRQFFGDGQLFTYDQKELAQVWLAANKAVNYWLDILGDKVFVLDYEKLVADQTLVTRQLLDFVGLDWNDRCLRFYENDHAVRTLSALQVRRALNNSRIGIWRRYEPWLNQMKSIVFGRELEQFSL